MHGDDISKSLIEENIAKRQIAHQIYRMKHVLIDYLNVLWATKDVINSLQYGDADLITNDEKLWAESGSSPITSSATSNSPSRCQTYSLRGSK